MMSVAARTLLLLVLLSPAETLRRSSKTDMLFHRRRRTRSVYIGLGWRQHYEKYTAELAKTSNPRGISEKCNSYISDPSRESRGLILLQHGYTACSGFWYKMTPRLVAAGWTVMVPNLPGHGRNALVSPNGTRSYQVQDYIEDLPTKGTEYETYSMELMEISGKYKKSNPGKEMVLAGCSHGGGVALLMAMKGEVGTWDRILLMNPFLAPPTGMGMDYGVSILRRLLPQLLPVFQMIKPELVSWGPECEEARWPGDIRASGHGGLCQFNLRNFRAVLEFGNVVEGEARARAAKLGVFTGGVIDRARGIAQLLTHKAWELLSGGGEEPPSNLQVQLVTTSNDGAISNARIHFAAAALSKSVHGSQSGYCAFPKEFTHTYINPIDKPFGSDLWWLDAKRTVRYKSVLDLLDAFINNGDLIPTDGTVKDDKWINGDPSCDIAKRRWR